MLLQLRIENLATIRKVEVEFNKELTNHSIIISFEIINPYQMKCVSLKVKSLNDYEITSTNIRNINIHTLIKRALKAIYSYKTIDTKEFNAKTNGYLSDFLICKPSSVSTSDKIFLSCRISSNPAR